MDKATQRQDYYNGVHVKYESYITEVTKQDMMIYSNFNPINVDLQLSHLIAMFTVLALTAVKLSLISLKQFRNSRNWALVTLRLVRHNRDRKCDGKI